MNIRRATRLLIPVLTLAWLLACSSPAKQGEPCDASGNENECESGAICGKNASTTLECLKVCTEQADCSADEECNGVEDSSLKGCRSKDDGSGGGKVK